MASLVERKTSRGASRLYAKFDAFDREQGRRRTFWELQPPAASKKEPTQAAKRRLTEIESLLAEHDDVWPPPTMPKERASLTFREAADDWLERHRTNLRPRVAACYELPVRLHLKPLIGNYRMRDIGPASRS